MQKEKDEWRHSPQPETCFSKTIKAGKRVYYIDVKQDRRDEYYIAMTESKRVQDGTEVQRPVFEKHKIFLYREDLIHFLQAFTDAVEYIGQHASLEPRVHEYERMAPEYDKAAPAVDTASDEAPVTVESDKIDLGSDFNIEF